MGILNKKLKGTTLIESIVSMMIIMMVFVMFIMVYTNVMSSDNGPQRLKATSVINELINETKMLQSCSDTTIKQDSITIVRNIKPGNSTFTELLIVRAMNKNGNIIARHEEIIVKQ